MSSPPAPGLGAEDIAVYRALLEEPSPPELLARRPELDAYRLADTLDRLLRLRLVRPSLVADGSYEVVSPELAAAELVAHIEAQAHALLRHSDTVRRELSGLSTLYHQARWRQLANASSELLTDSEEVRRRLQELALQARGTVVAAHPTMAHPQALAAGLSLDSELLARGVEYRVIFPHTARRQQHGRDHIKALRGLGALIRTAAIVPARLLIIDGEVAVIPLQPDLGHGAAIVRDAPVIAFLASIFEHTWDRATLIEHEHTPNEVFEEVELAILTELAMGRTDESIARRLGISTRTLRRYLTSLTERLGVDTRFQMGVAAYEAGLVTRTHPGRAEFRPAAAAE